MDVPLHLGEFHLPVEDLQHLGDALRQGDDFQDLLLLLGGQRDVRGDQVHHAGRVFQGGDRLEHLARQFLVADRELLEGLGQFTHVSRHIRPVHVRVRGLHQTDRVERILRLAALEAADHQGAALALDQGLDGPVGQSQQLHHRGQGAQGVQVAVVGIVDPGVLLGDQKDRRAVRHGRLQGGDGFFPADHQRGDHAREQDNVPQGHEGVGFSGQGSHR